MLSPEKQFFTKLLKSGGLEEYTKLKTQGLSKQFFSKPYHDVYDFVDYYSNTYGQLPTTEEVLTKFGSLESILFSAEVPTAPMDAIYDNVVEISLREKLHDDLMEIAEKMQEESYDPFKVLSLVQERSRRLTSQYVSTKAESLTLSDAAQLLLDELDGKIEVPQGAASALLFVEDQARGIQPAEVTTIAAKTGVGKTWLLLLNAVTIATGNPYHFYDEMTLPEDCTMLSKEERNNRKKRVLILSLEMPAMAIMRRLASLAGKVSYSRYRANELSGSEKKKLKSVLEFINDDPAKKKVGANIQVIGPDVAHTPEAVAAAASEFEADVVMIDGFYLMPGPGEKRWEKVEANMQQLRMHSLQSSRHYMLATQLGKQAKSLDSTDIDSLSFSASIGHDSNNIFAIVQTKNDASANIANITSLKMRDGIPGLEYVYNWDHQECLYTQQGLVADESFEEGLGLI